MTKSLINTLYEIRDLRQKIFMTKYRLSEDESKTRELRSLILRYMRAVGANDFFCEYVENAIRLPFKVKLRTGYITKQLPNNEGYLLVSAYSIGEITQEYKLEIPLEVITDEKRLEKFEKAMSIKR